jgi:hypothetical protein
MTPNQAIYQAVDLLTRSADALHESYTNSDSEWTCDADTKADYAHILTVVATLRQALRNDIDGMAECMDMVRQDLINMGIIGADIAPRFIPEAVAGAIQKAVAAEREACAVLAGPHGEGLIAAAIRARGTA